ncbi:hypothetical protein E6L38_09640, partial [Bifidobacterium longum subsp. infantis]
RTATGTDGVSQMWGHRPSRHPPLSPIRNRHNHYQRPLLIILLVCEEWDKGSALVTFTQVPKRSRIVIAKTVVAVLIFSASFAASLLLTLIVSVTTSSIHHFSLNWEASLSGFLTLALPLLVNMGLGLAMALFSRSTVISISLYFIIPPVTVMLSQIHSISEYARWISLGHSSSIFVAGLTPQTYSQIVVSVIFWIALPFALGFVNICRRDIA